LKLYKGTQNLGEEIKERIFNVGTHPGSSRLRSGEFYREPEESFTVLETRASG